MPKEAVIVPCATGRLQLAGARLSQEVPGMGKGGGLGEGSDRNGQGLVLVITYPILLDSIKYFICMKMHREKIIIILSSH